MREVLVKIGLKQEDDKERVIMEALLDSRAIGLVMSLEFARKNKFKKKKLERPIYVRNMDSTLVHKGPFEYMVEIKLFYKEHKERTEIDVIEGQK